jgi:hypothetical protein
MYNQGRNNAYTSGLPSAGISNNINWGTRSYTGGLYSDNDYIRKTFIQASRIAYINMYVENNINNHR